MPIQARGFFIDMLTRDISLEDAILDMVDNSIDAVIRKQHIDIEKATLELSQQDNASDSNKNKNNIWIEFGETQFKIRDDCGGIDFESAKDEVFRLGRMKEGSGSRLSVYGIGLKRALFKIGKKFSMESSTTNSGFTMDVDVENWMRDDEGEEPDWHLPIEKIEGSSKPGTTIVIRNLKPQILMRIKEGTLEKRIVEILGLTFALFLGRFVNIYVNNLLVEGNLPPLGSFPEVEPSIKHLRYEDVDILIMTGLQAREKKTWNSDKAGWYFLCNGRVVVAKDKTELSDWGITLPTFVSKFRGFVGIVLFYSDNPESLPWRTTKRGINSESQAYHVAREAMVAAARPVLKFLNGMYTGDEEDHLSPSYRVIAQNIKKVDMRDHVTEEDREFKPKVKKKPRDSKITYQVRSALLERVKEEMGFQSWSNSKIGKHTFEYFVAQEVPDE